MNTQKIGLISDTHGILRSEAKRLLGDCDHIIHAGDIDDIRILNELKSIAPTTAVKGNMDFGAWAQNLKEIERIVFGKWSILIVHNVDHLSQTENKADIVIFGHSHRFSEKKNGQTLLINPGSAGPRRFSLPITMAILHLGEEVIVERIQLQNKT